MKNRRRNIVAATALLTIGLTIGLAAPSADAIHIPFEKGELKCRKGIAKGFLKAVTTADKTSGSCHKDRQKGKVLPAVDCNDLGPEPGTLGAADSKEKFAKAQQKLIDTPAKKCVGLDDDIRNLFLSCPADCESALALPNPLTSLGQAVQCLACVAGEVIEDANAARLGSPDPASMSADDQKCAQSIAKGYAKYLAGILKTRTKCQDASDKVGGDELAPTCQTSSDPDGKGKIAKALSKAEDGIDKSCSAAELSNVGSCATTNLTDLKSCLAAQTDAADVVAFPAHYQLDATICPTGLRSLILAGIGVNGVSASFLDIGWTGFAHNFEVPDNYHATADVTCPNSSPPCGDCTIDGIRQSGLDYAVFTRCTNDFATKCDEPFATDADDCGGSFCTYVLGSPLPISAAGSPTCTVNALAGDISGTANVETGEGALNLQFATRVHTGDSSTLTQPCPLCVGDVTPNDGVADGVCEGGARDTMPCDTNGFDATFAPSSAGLGLSLDCVPPLAENISGTGLKINLPLTTGATSLAAATKCDGAISSVDCFCALCSGDTTLTCRDNSDCVAAAAGTCTSNTAAGALRQPNACNNFANCVDIGDEKGKCSDKSEMFCEGLVRANGRGFLACLNNAECINMDFPCADGDCGPCTLVEQRSCFLDPIEAAGVADIKNPIVAGTFCIPPTINVGINGTSGSPGPARVVTEQLTTRLYD